MAGPYTLNPEQGWGGIPTWHLGKSTKLCVQNLDASRSGQVYIKSSDASTPASEYVEVAPGGTTCIERYWAGIPINANNSGFTRVQVWTE